LLVDDDSRPALVAAALAGALTVGSGVGVVGGFGDGVGGSLHATSASMAKSGADASEIEDERRAMDMARMLTARDPSRDLRRAILRRASVRYLDALGFGAGGLALGGGFFADADALTDALGVLDATGSGVGVGAGVGAGAGSALVGVQMSPPEGPTAVGVGGDGRGELPHAANAANETTSATSRKIAIGASPREREGSGEARRCMRRMVARVDATHNRILPRRIRSGRPQRFFAESNGARGGLSYPMTVVASGLSARAVETPAAVRQLY